MCFLAGTNQERTLADTSGDKCWCQVGYFGADCGIPEAAWFSMYKDKFPDTRLTPRTVPRRIINGLPVNHEYAMFEARNARTVRLRGLPLLKGLRDDDLFVLSDADELPTKEVVTFLKVYDGYPEPVSFALRWNVFGFFWQKPPDESWWTWLKGPREALSEVSSAATISMLRDVLYNNAFYIRKSGLWQYYRLAKNLRHYRDRGHYVKEWVVGTSGHYAGWHCSWCFSPENMIRKMDSAQTNDVPSLG
ncbi:hypothetical protein Pmani_033488 [Petrolisthes manimaculis]|uniref:Beta-1,4-mannosyl-glycoprotein 4-beta-N-acetylglucosaminyltransferase n=1 Tax=Petrolisthes manimaculis TaxID=1843537 RepID=A0AAE1NPM0_9EUCA|nr:hypothetical protein Pmani_033488 [Petrolisthes manimaculis]